MISGRVNDEADEATLHLIVFDFAGEPHEIEAIIDTGFTGFLTLPNMLISTLGLPWTTSGIVILANGAAERTAIHSVTVLWLESRRSIHIEAAETQPLLGMAL